MKMTDTDLQLLACYSRERGEEAFAELVRRHINLVYSAALRQVRSPQLAEEVAQSVFADLARNSGRLKPDTILTGWLYQVTRRTAVDVIRREARRQAREQIACERNAMNAPEPNWSHIEPLLDEAVAGLDETDRTAVLLRYFENKSLREVGAQLGVSDDAAQKRVTRAVERLREHFLKRGVTPSAGLLAGAISAHAVHAAPAGLVVTICSSTTLTGAALTTTATLIASKAIAMTTLQKTVLGATIAVLAGTGMYQAHQGSRLRAENRLLQATARQHQQLNQERDALLAQLAVLRDENNRAQSNAVELLKLRDEVARLQSDESKDSKRVVTSVSASTTTTDRTSTATELPKDTWTDAGFATPQSALQTRGWAVLSSNRDRFKESVLITDGARKAMEAMLEQMIAAAPAAERQRFSQQVLSNNLGLEDGLLFPMVAENQAKGYTSYRILSERPIADDERLLEVETRMASAIAKTETLRFRKAGDAWKVVIDEDFIKSQMQPR